MYNISSIWKNPELRQKSGVSHPSGRGFQELDTQEIDFIAGGSGNAETQATPTVATPLTPYTVEISVGGAVSAVSGLVSYTKDCV